MKNLKFQQTKYFIYNLRCLVNQLQFWLSGFFYIDIS